MGCEWVLGSGGLCWGGEGSEGGEWRGVGDGSRHLWVAVGSDSGDK